MCESLKIVFNLDFLTFSLFRLKSYLVSEPARDARLEFLEKNELTRTCRIQTRISSHKMLQSYHFEIFRQFTAHSLAFALINMLFILNKYCNFFEKLLLCENKCTFWNCMIVVYGHLLLLCKIKYDYFVIQCLSAL